MTSPTLSQEAARGLLLTLIAASGLSRRQYAERVLVRDERTLRRWLAGETIPRTALRWIERQT